MSLLSWIKNLLTPKPAQSRAELGRNELCWCGSGKKYKKCHLAKDEKNKFEEAYSARIAAQSRRSAGLTGGGTPAAPRRPEKLMEDRKK